MGLQETGGDLFRAAANRREAGSDTERKRADSTAAAKVVEKRGGVFFLRQRGRHPAPSGRKAISLAMNRLILQFTAHLVYLLSAYGKSKSGTPFINSSLILLKGIKNGFLNTDWNTDSRICHLKQEVEIRFLITEPASHRT